MPFIDTDFGFWLIFGGPMCVLGGICFIGVVVSVVDAWEKVKSGNHD